MHCNIYIVVHILLIFLKQHQFVCRHWLKCFVASSAWKSCEMPGCVLTVRSFAATPAFM